MATTANGILSMARLGVSLRWRLSTNRLRRRGRRTRRFVVLAAIGYAVANVVVLGSARGDDPAAASATLVLLMSSMALGWVFGPVLIGGVDETIDPTRLALFPLSALERYVLQLAAALSGMGPMATIFGLVIGLSIGHVGVGISLIVVPVAALTAVLAMVGSARSLAAGLAIAQRSRAGRDLAVLLAALAGGTMFTMAQLGRNVASLGESPLVTALSWSPWAWPARAINAARAGHEVSSLVWLAAALAVTIAMHLAWMVLSNFLLHNGERNVTGGRSAGRTLLNGSTSPFGASLSRQWIYLRRSPNSRVGLVFGTVFGVAFAMVQIVQQGAGSGAAAAFGILLAMLANLGASTNVLGFDAGSLWIEVLADGPRRAHMIARELIALPNLLLPTWLSGLVVGVWTGEWRLVLLVSLLALPVAVNVLTFGLIASVLAPAPLPDLDNPFGNRQGNESRGIRIAVIAVAGLVTIAVFSTPMFVLVFRVLDEWYLWLMPFAGLAYAAVLFSLAAGWAGLRLSGREPHLIETLAPRALN